MKKLIALLISGMVFFVCINAFALPINRSFQDLKLPTQVLLERQEILNITAATTTAVLSSHAGPTSAAARTITSGFTSPVTPRNLTITPDGSTGAVNTCTVTVSGTNILNTAITEEFTFTADQSTATTGSKAFKTITSIAWAASCEVADYDATWSIGTGEKIGLKRCMDYAGNLAWTTVAGAYESTRPTVTADADEVEKNTVDFDGTMNGTNDFQVFFLQNFRCL